MAKTELFVRQQPGGVFAVVNQSVTTGNIWFVNSGSATGSNSVGYGQNPDAPFLTLDYAVGQCTASNGDVIYAMPGHAETISAAAGLDLDVAGITIVGLGNGALQPTVTLGTSANADIDVDAANITVENLHFIANFQDIVAAIDVNEDDFTLRRCRFSEAGTDLNALIWVQDAAAGGSDRITIEDCRVVAPDSTNTHFVNFAGTGTGHVIRRNVLIGDWGTAAIGGAGIITWCVVADNYISNQATDADSCIKLAATTTGIVANNRVGANLAGNATTNITANGCMMCENYSVDIGDRQGVLDPIAT